MDFSANILIFNTFTLLYYPAKIGGESHSRLIKA